MSERLPRYGEVWRYGGGDLMFIVASEESYLGLAFRVLYLNRRYTDRMFWVNGLSWTRVS